MSELDRLAVSSGAIPERALIENAGREIARLIASRWSAGRVVAVVGSGHNGADALVALRTLRAWGRDVIAIQGSARPPHPDVLVGWELPLEPTDHLGAAASGAGVLIDGLLGTGLTGPPRPAATALIEAIDRAQRPVVAVDGPSGGDLSTGEVPGACVRADLTVALGWPKLGHFLRPVRDYCGDLYAVEIGFPPLPAPLGARAITARWVRDLLPPRPPGAHKRDAGYLTVVAGGSGMAGAAVLAARAALRGGAGIVRLVADPVNRDVLQTAVPGAIFIGWDRPAAVDEAVRWADAVVVGPGLGRSAERRELVERVLTVAGTRPLLLDADGLSVWEGRGELLRDLLPERSLLTPHPGEWARIGEDVIADIRAAPFAAARNAARKMGCAVLLKGDPTSIAVEGEPLRVATTGGGALAAGGTGDVLAGLIGAYMAVGLAPADAGTAALLVSGIAALEAPHPIGHLAADLPARFPSVRARVAALPDASDDSVRFAQPAGTDGELPAGPR